MPRSTFPPPYSISRLARRTALATLAVACLAAGSCAATGAGTQQAQCDEQHPCNPGYRCEQGTCVAFSYEDAGVPDAWVPPDSSGVDVEIPCAEGNFPYSEMQESFQVPINAKYMIVKLWGAGGNDEGVCPWAQGGAGTDGGQGGFTTAVFEVKPGTALAPGTELVILVGQKGRAGGTDSVFGFGVRGGGGLTGVFFGPGPITATDQAKALAIAGGGGSSGPPGCNPGGPGNHPEAGGMPTMEGGVGNDPDSIIGGGAGHAGGLGGDLGVAGKGGTGYVDTSLALDYRIRYAEPGDNPVPGSDDEDYIAAGGTAGRSEQAGLAVIKFVCTLPPPL